MSAPPRSLRETMRDLFAWRLIAALGRLGVPLGLQGSTGRDRMAWPQGRVDVTVDAERLDAMFARVAAQWQALGEDRAHWSVLTNPDYLPEAYEGNRAAFEESGRADAALIRVFAERNGVDLTGLAHCLEFGCGVGRITRHLADLFPQVTGVDISEPHLAHARMATAELAGVSLLRLERAEAVDALPSFDVLYSVIVLQHNPPPIIHGLIDGLLAKLNPGGVALLQVPVAYLGYHFDADRYLAGTHPGMEMHILPQRHLFDLFARHRCTVLELCEDDFVGRTAPIVSNTVFVQKSR